MCLCFYNSCFFLGSVTTLYPFNLSHIPISCTCKFSSFYVSLFLLSLFLFPVPFDFPLQFVWRLIWSILAFCYYITCAVGCLIFGSIYVRMDLNESNDSRF